ncbi:hypothetical protein DYBT9275_03631 [Dyadobacter sp. CECT 9275]|uniref:Type IX secretion system protein PorQ n=1 Tax=Dyadobacter helix TaxID=2822344 RepID=A0A916JDW0_9BACT|nr:type IX secretion system protein PorQ [Dyadobacter sp. CECT 9275]CAG5005695.1 hypothetical protein DYBT9275_03631 [Dyadobacter sp. CECT 9275]
MRQIRRSLFVLTGFVGLFPFLSMGQIAGGRSTLNFLQLPSQSFNTALGANQVTSNGSDPALYIQNPALLDTVQTDRVSLNLMPYLADTKFVNLAYARQLKRTGGIWSAGLQYLNYGTMAETDDIGNVIGEFRAADYSISAGYGHQLGAFTIGGAVKFVGAAVEAYQVWGLATDWGASFKHPEEDFTAGFVVKNIGFLRRNYSGGEEPVLPLDVRAGVTFKPKYMPLRFSFSVHHLNKFDMVYNDPALFYTYDADGNKISRKVGWAEKAGRHLSLGAEVLIHPQFRLLLGYDHLRRQELRLVNKGALAGFSFGAWLRIKRFEVGYGRAQYTPGFGSSSLSLVMDLRKRR